MAVGAPPPLVGVQYSERMAQMEKFNGRNAASSRIDSSQETISPSGSRAANNSGVIRSTARVFNQRLTP